MSGIVGIIVIVRIEFPFFAVSFLRVSGDIFIAIVIAGLHVDRFVRAYDRLLLHFRYKIKGKESQVMYGGISNKTGAEDGPARQRAER